MQNTKHFFLPTDQALFDYDYIFSASSMWVDLGMQNVDATFDLTVRDLPLNRNFLLFNGLEEIINGILNWKFSKDDIAFLLNRKIIGKNLAALLKNFKFDGDVWAMPEGTVFFPQEPVVRITGKLWQINLFTFFLINSLSSNTIFASKLARCFLAAQNKIYVATCPPVRGHAHEASLKFGRSAYLFGSASGMVPGFAKKFGIVFTSRARAFHAFIKSFPTELEAMRSAAKIFPDCSVMIDTYDLTQGTANAIKVALEQKSKNLPIFSAVFIDSAKSIEDFIARAKFVRRSLDKAGLQKIQITVAGNFQEYKIAQLVKSKAPIDKVILGTEAITPADDPKLEAVLKMAQFTQNSTIHQTAKLATGKTSYPGIKQVFRKYKNGKLHYDTIGLSTENHGTPLLQQFVLRGKLIKHLPSLDEIKKYTALQLQKLNNPLKRINGTGIYKIKISDELTELLAKSKKQHLL